MPKQTFKFSTASTHIFFDASIAQLKEIIDVKQAVFITDENIFAAHAKNSKVIIPLF